MLAQKKVLVLNKNWQAISVVTLEKALTKLCKSHKDGTPKARIIDCVNDFQSITWEDWTKLRPKDGEDGIKSVNAIFRIPEVIQYTRYDKLPVKKIHYNRSTIYRRDNSTCQYCFKKMPGNELSLDHVIPRCQGGKSTWENIVVACTKCNTKKAGRTPQEAGMKLLKLPRKPVCNFYSGDFRVESWQNFLGMSYWLTELDNDND